MPITLYDLAGDDEDLRFSPHCWRVRMALVHKGLAFETVPWRFIEKDAIAFSGQKLVPVMTDGSHWGADSWEIARYLETTWRDRPSLFGGAVGEAEALFVKHWTEQVVHPAIFRIILLDLFAVLHEKDKAYFRESREKRVGCSLEAFAQPNEHGVAALRASLVPLGATLARQPFVGGASPTFGDYLLFGAFMWARAVSPIALIEADDPVHAWRERLLDAFDGYARKARSAHALL